MLRPLALLLCGVLVGCSEENNTSLPANSFPLTEDNWVKIPDNSSTVVLDLPHGWLVYRADGFGGGMTFVPKLGK